MDPAGDPAASSPRAPLLAQEVGNDLPAPWADTPAALRRAVPRGPHHEPMSAQGVDMLEQFRFVGSYSYEPACTSVHEALAAERTALSWAVYKDCAQQRPTTNR